MRVSEIKRSCIVEQDLEFIISHQLNWALLEGKTVLITGANGFLSAYMVETILFLNECKFSTPTKVIGLVRNIDKAQQRFRFYEERKDLILIQVMLMSFLIVIGR